MRTDTDTWDIQTSVGSTALAVAAGRALARHPANGAPIDPYAELFCRAAGGQWSDLVQGKQSDHALSSEDFGRSFANFQAARTAFFDNFLTTTGDTGVRQIVLLASGLDCRAYRLQWPAETEVYELDQPLVQQFKQETLDAHGAAPSAVRHPISVDLRQDWSTILQESGFDPSRPSAWLVEGLLFFLKSSAQDLLLETIDSLAAPGSHIAVEQRDTYPDIEFEMRRAVAADSAEPGGSPLADFLALIYNESRSEAATWLRGRGWAAERIALLDYMNASGFELPAYGSVGWDTLRYTNMVTAAKR
ncbi:SAM-dependent methyltransferase [Mycobacteroides abscessus subsp. abscessus]|uniref:S-adenosyl-L-methionine-dependent methyltransferase n=2 Tax=Mycobacteroides abscessus TaxID=36809 RepID=A0ABD7HS09_9MYCO|nr:SAM-dependent methyltransferase [Mycobacteroides abscessus]AWG62655.1 SAM-dependent methyltransferase [Mycobacteroides abscessus]EIT93258.1 putative S-adenosyl-L-methionine-dependent methyltransferase [Mycobacteroides abscessus 4S-0726-RB]EIU00798.1 putative S-adenosyl-L-methionine-dependent methyltransferase [Mycobacteroides abscessus 4S-0726-RA]EIU03041.1 putative S-adenosyl-L-methionine-dependent methyltransferase [Mycobacteroides abscessus 4S-0303]EIV10184.1 putative S-adenosyl-L-methio